jgi:hypothetical protein
MKWLLIGLGVLFVLLILAAVALFLLVVYAE